MTYGNRWFDHPNCLGKADLKPPAESRLANCWGSLVDYLQAPPMLGKELFSVKAFPPPPVMVRHIDGRAQGQQDRKMVMFDFFPSRVCKTTQVDKLIRW